MAYDSHKNFAYSLIAIAPSPSTSGTSITVTAGQGALFPIPPFNATVWPAASIPITTNSEIVRVTNITGDVLTITRAQESTTARAIIAGDQIANTITAKLLTDIESALPQTIALVAHKFLTAYNATTGLFANAQPDYSDLTGTPSIPAAALIDTRANILATSAATVRLAFATDTLRVYFADGTNWNETPIEWATRTSAPDMGYTQNSSRAGYGQDYVTDKNLANVAVGSNANVANASATFIPIRASAGTLQIYVSGAWQIVASNFLFREDSLWGYALEHKPIGFTTWIEVMSGSSLNNLGFNGLPTVNHYIVDMGAYPAPSLVGGRTVG